MEPDDLIKKAMQSSGRVITGKDWFMVEGDPVTNTLRVIPADIAIGDNIVRFIRAEQPGYICLGMFTNRQIAEEAITAMRTLLRAENS